MLVEHSEWHQPLLERMGKTAVRYVPSHLRPRRYWLRERGSRRKVKCKY